MDPILDQLIADFAQRPLPELTDRRLDLPHLPGKAHVILGMRRSGKTYYLFQRIRALVDQGVGLDRLLYLNFEDDRLSPFGAQDLQRIPEAFFRRYPERRGEKCWFFLDEIQNVEGWERFVRRLLDTEPIELVLTGSSAKMLSREIATSLRGRSFSTEILPFSFEESLLHRGIDLPDRWPPPAAQRSKLESELLRYLKEGGFPEVQGLEPHLRVRVLQDYVDVVLLRDVAERHQISNVHGLRYLQRSLLSRPSNRFSLHKLYNDLKSQGVTVGKDSLYAYMEHLEDAYLIFTTHIASRSLRVRQSNPRKCYPIDPGLAAASSFSAAEDSGHLLETIVFLELRRRGFRMHYVQTEAGHEVDFLAEHAGGERLLIQVSARLDQAKTREREVRALKEAMREQGLKHSTIVTLQEAERVTVESGDIDIVPAWSWLLRPANAG